MVSVISNIVGTHLLNLGHNKIVVCLESTPASLKYPADKILLAKHKGILVWKFLFIFLPIFDKFNFKKNVK